MRHAVGTIGLAKFWALKHCSAILHASADPERVLVRCHRPLSHKVRPARYQRETKRKLRQKKKKEIKLMLWLSPRFSGISSAASCQDANHVVPLTPQAHFPRNTRAYETVTLGRTSPTSLSFQGSLCIPRHLKTEDAFKRLRNEQQKQRTQWFLCLTIRGHGSRNTSARAPGGSDVFPTCSKATNLGRLNPISSLCPMRNELRWRRNFGKGGRELEYGQRKLKGPHCSCSELTLRSPLRDRFSLP